MLWLFICTLLLRRMSEKSAQVAVIGQEYYNIGVFYDTLVRQFYL